MNTHTTIEGRGIEYPHPAPDVAAFLERLRRAAEDRKVGIDDMIALVYGPDNPVLDHTLLAGRATVTAEALANPLYRVMSDLVGVKRVRLGLLDVEAVRAAHTVSVRDAARQLGVTPQGVRVAIDSWKLGAVRRDGQWWIRPESIAAFRVSARGRPRKDAAPAAEVRPVAVRVGGEKGASLSVRIEGGDLEGTTKDGQAVRGRFPAAWTRAIVRTTTRTGARAFVIEPDDAAEEGIEHGGLFVRGGFAVVEKLNSTAAAAKRWKEADRKATA